MNEAGPASMSAPPDEVRAQLEKILASKTLGGSDQLKRLLRLTVERTLNGHSELLKEYNLGLEVFQRPPDYDPKTDPIVRVQARRLRSKLDEYYAGEGAGDPLVIQIPKGAYVPVFAAQQRTSQPARSLRWLAALLAAVALTAVALVWAARSSAVAQADMDRAVAVLPLQSFDDGGGRAGIADQIGEVLTTELAKRKDLRVLSRTTARTYGETRSPLPEIASELGVRWIVEGGVGVEGTRAYVKLRAVDSRTDRKIWADVFDCDLSELVRVSAQAADRIAEAIAQQIRSSDEARPKAAVTPRALAAHAAQ